MQASPFSGPNLPLGQLDEILVEVYEILEELPPIAAVHALYVHAAQCKAAIAAGRRHTFSGDVRRSLTAKVLHLETDTLAARRALLDRAGRRRRR